MAQMMTYNEIEAIIGGCISGLGGAGSNFGGAGSNLGGADRAVV